MRIIFLNAWKNNQVKELRKFILDNLKTTDIFCFQESLDSKDNNFCQPYFSDYQFFFAKKFVDSELKLAQSTFIKKGLKVLDTQVIGNKDPTVGLTLFNKIETKDKKILNIFNVHGIFRPGHKQDTPNRLRQSQQIIDFLKDLSGSKIVGGDFNLDLKIKSTQIFKDNGFKNLIEKFNIPTTRNEISWKKYKNKQLFADHTFITSDLKIKDFIVPNIKAADHLPMILDFDL